MKTDHSIDTQQATCPVCRGKVRIPNGSIDDEGNYSLDCPRCQVPVTGKIEFDS
jgi:endogenous inhibitor of DNA gyrase (YacG/DUF329 family)